MTRVTWIGVNVEVDVCTKPGILPDQHVGEREAPVHAYTPAPTRPAATGAGPVVVASIPSGHVYVRHLSPEDGGGPVRLPDPDPDDSTRSATQRWWPPAMLDAAWVESNDFDVAHLHFGFDSRSPRDLASWVAALRRRRKPLVYTVHDLRNPHHAEPGMHDEQLDVLVPAADALITLTDGAAEEIHRRWQREAVVLPHPHVVDLQQMPAWQATRAAHHPDEFRIGLHLKSLRSSMDPMTLLPVILETVRDLPGARLRVNGHHDVLTPGGARYDRDVADYVHHAARAGDLDLRVHDFFTDRELWAYFASLDASLLPYRFGTHSGWLEACRDIGTTVIAPSCGYYADQGPVLGYGLDEHSFDPDSLDRALRTAYGDRPALGTDVAARRRQRQHVARSHDQIYRAVLARR